MGDFPLDTCVHSLQWSWRQSTSCHWFLQPCSDQISSSSFSRLADMETKVHYVDHISTNPLSLQPNKSLCVKLSSRPLQYPIARERLFQPERTSSAETSAQATKPTHGCNPLLTTGRVRSLQKNQPNPYSADSALCFTLGNSEDRHELESQRCASTLRAKT